MGEGRAKGPDNKIQNSLAIKYKHAMFLRWERGEKWGIREERLFWERSCGVPPHPVDPSPPRPRPSVSAGLCLCGSCAHFPSPLPAQPPPSPPLIAAIPVAACCHSAVTPLPIIFGGGIEGVGWEGKTPARPPPAPAASTRSPGGGKSRGHSTL